MYAVVVNRTDYQNSGIRTEFYIFREYDNALRCAGEKHDTFYTNCYLKKYCPNCEYCNNLCESCEFAHDDDCEEPSSEPNSCNCNTCTECICGESPCVCYRKDCESREFCDECKELVDPLTCPHDDFCVRIDRIDFYDKYYSRNVQSE